MPQDNIETSPKKGETSEAFRDRIEETRRELERQKAAVPAGSASPEKASEQVGASGAVAHSTEPTPATATRGVIPEVDEWWSKKGFKSPEDIANSYRELERELTRKNQELQRQQQVPIQTPPPAPYYPVAPAYVPPPYVPPIPQQTAEQLAEQYGLAPEDFKKVYAIANDLSQVNVQRELNRIMPGIVRQVQQVSGDVTRQREMVDLMSEPTWKNPQVQFEMHKVLTDDPTIIQRQALPYRYAHDEALKRIARVNLGGSNYFNGSQSTDPASSGSRPPTLAGSNGKAVPVAPTGSNAGEMTPEQYAGLPLNQKREFLRGIGALTR